MFPTKHTDSHCRGYAVLISILMISLVFLSALISANHLTFTATKVALYEEAKNYSLILAQTCREMARVALLQDAEKNIEGKEVKEEYGICTIHNIEEFPHNHFHITTRGISDEAITTLRTTFNRSTGHYTKEEIVE